MLDTLTRLSRRLLLAIAVFPLGLMALHGCSFHREVASATTRAATDPAVRELVGTIPYGDAALSIIGAAAALVLAVDRYIDLKRGATPRK